MAPFSAIDTRTFSAPSALRRRAYFSISSSVSHLTPKSSPSSKLLGFIRNGLYLSTFISRLPVASTVKRTPFPDSIASIFSYMSGGRVSGTLPASTNISPLSRRESFSNSSFIFSSGISGPLALRSVSLSDFSFTFMRENPLSSRIKSHFIPFSISRRSMCSPVKPAVKPRAAEESPSSLNTTETFIPFPPAVISSYTERHTLPGTILSNRIT